MIVVDSGERRLIGLDPDGRLNFVEKGEQRRKGFYNARPLGFDSAGRFYMDDTVLEMESNNVEARRIQRFSGSGRFMETVLEYSFEGEAMYDWEAHPVFGQMHGDDLYWFARGDDGAWKLLDLDTVRGGELRTVALPDIDIYNSVACVAVSPDEIYLLRQDGSIDQWTPQEGLVRWFGNEDSGPAIRFPTGMILDNNKDLLVTDTKAQVYRLKTKAGPPGLIPVFAGAITRKDGSLRPVGFQALSALPDGSLMFSDEYTSSLVTIDPEGSVSTTDKAAIGFWIRLALIIIWSSVSMAACLCVAAVIVFYSRLMRYRSPLAVKQLVIMLPVIAIMVASVAFYVYGTLSATLGTQIRDRLLHLAHLGAGRLAGNEVESIGFDTLGYQELLDSGPLGSATAVLDELVNLNEDPWNSSIYPYLYRKSGDRWWIVGSFDYVEPYPYEKPEFDAVMENGGSGYSRYTDVYGAWLSAIAPVRNEDGKAVAIFEASMSADILDEASRVFATRAIIGGGSILVAFLGMLGVFTWFLLRSVKKLQRGVERVAAGDYEITVAINSRDELEDLGDAFNGMSKEIKNYVDRLAAFNAANARFVPKEFLHRLGRETITDIRLGDQILTDMTVLFSDIREFTTISERVGPGETITMLNDYLSRMGPAIRANGGFIDKYIGDAIMALFPGTVDTAVEGMLAMMDELDTYRAELLSQGKPVTEAGFGIHTGPLMLGIIGETERFEGTVIADTVNLASRLESLTKYYGVRAVLSGTSVKQLTDKRRPVRFIDKVQVKGKNQSVSIYELIGRGDPLREGKLSSVPAYLEAFRLYAAGDFMKAEAAFASILARVGEDPPALLNLERCRRYLRDGAPANWTGVTIFHEK
jgi:class 3 adenylate cyclase/HAMP domain-containing protein